MLHVVLERPSHPGNIGSVARAMKTTGVENLVLFSPEKYPDPMAAKMATHGIKVLDQAKVIDNLEGFLANMDFIVACTKRPRSLQIDHMSPGIVAPFVHSELKKAHEVAFLFGNETTGLSNSVIELAHVVVEIPMACFDDSLNLSHAVQVVLYELFKIEDSIPQVTTAQRDEMPLSDEKTLFESHLYDIINEAGLIKHSSTWVKIRNMLRRARPDRRELQLLFGLLKAIKPVPKTKENNDLL